MSEVDELYERLKKFQEAKGYYFNKDRERTFDFSQPMFDGGLQIAVPAGAARLTRLQVPA